ncbi:hypothetical protein L1987_69401 [Smallanthus sonchifolius]|uniref:Uncharacterized protein n=1 Tax=Smallanthus sonchifolius TaxID=185202 RepID=A0ACB9B7S6_9ASTR|nr:hypothetical protein L1987_69401 [Smallanthus sonchifolius]
MMLKEKDKQVEKIQHDINDRNLKYSEAINALQRILELTNKVMSGIEHEGRILSNKKQLETEVDVMMETLRSRKMEVLQTRRALTVKENELKMVLEKLNQLDREMKAMKQNADGLRKLYVMGQERIGEKNSGDLMIEKMQLELEVEAARSALEKITEMSRELLHTTSLSVVVDDLDVSGQTMPENEVHVCEDGCFAELKSELQGFQISPKNSYKRLGLLVMFLEYNDCIRAKVIQV